MILQDLVHLLIARHEDLKDEPESEELFLHDLLDLVGNHINCSVSLVPRGGIVPEE